MSEESTTQSSRMTLPRPGLLGRIVRLTLAAVVLFGLYDAVRFPTSYWDGFSDPIGALPLFLPLVLFSGWVVNELLRKKWGWWPNIVLSAGAGVAMMLGTLKGDAWGAPLGYYVWVWQILFSGLLGPGFLLAALLRTPGCEMRSYAHFWAKLRGGDVNAAVCPGWIDRLDGIRLFGRW